MLPTAGADGSSRPGRPTTAIAHEALLVTFAQGKHGSAAQTCCAIALLVSSVRVRTILVLTRQARPYLLRLRTVSGELAEAFQTDAQIRLTAAGVALRTVRRQRIGFIAIATLEPGRISKIDGIV